MKWQVRKEERKWFAKGEFKRRRKQREEEGAGMKGKEIGSEWTRDSVIKKNVEVEKEEERKKRRSRKRYEERESKGMEGKKRKWVGMGKKREGMNMYCEGRSRREEAQKRR